MILQVGALFLLAVSVQAHVAVSHQHRVDKFNHHEHQHKHEVHHKHHEHKGHDEHKGHHEHKAHVEHKGHQEHHEVKQHDDHHTHHPSYKFEYSVHDPHTHDVKSQREERKGDHVIGSYSLVEPNGHKRTVHYEADDHHGFRAKVHREEVHHHHHHHHHDHKGHH